MARHTEEPWRVVEGSVDVRDLIREASPGKHANICQVFATSKGQAMPMSANSRRIVACVNACIDVPLERLYGLSVAQVLRELDVLREELDVRTEAMLTGDDLAGLPMGTPIEVAMDQGNGRHG